MTAQTAIGIDGLQISNWSGEVLTENVQVVFMPSGIPGRRLLVHQESVE